MVEWSKPEGRVSQSIAVFGAGPGLGQAVAHRYAREGYTVVLVARRQEPLDQCARELANAGATAHVITADLSRTEAIPRLTEQIRAQVGNLDAFYYAPTPGMDYGFIPATHLTSQRAQDFMPLAVYTLLALVREFLPHMLEQGAGAILTAQGASAVQGMPNMSGPGPALAAQRNYLQSLHAEVADKGISVGRLYIGAAIENTPFHAWMEATKAAGDPVPAMPTADPAHLADLLWTMHNTKEQPQEATYPETLFGQPTQAQARPLSERREAAREHLRSHSHLWLATASDGRGPHLIPVSYWWDGSRLTTATFENSRTLRNVRAQPKVRGLGRKHGRRAHDRRNGEHLFRRRHRHGSR
jgi:short-subunit dehydrogenase